MSNTIKIILVDDHKMFREGIKFLLSKIGKYEVIAEANDGAELFHILDDQVPDIILLDISLPGLSGMEIAEILSKIHPEIKILVLSMYSDEEYYQTMVKFGVKGFLLKESGSTELEDALECVVNGESYFSQELLKRIINSIHNKPDTDKIRKEIDLTERENVILKLICKGQSNQEIAKQLFISLRTVEIHKTHLFEKTNSKNAINLILFALKNKLIEL